MNAPHNLSQYNNIIYNVEQALLHLRMGGQLVLDGKKTLIAVEYLNEDNLSSFAKNNNTQLVVSNNRINNISSKNKCDGEYATINVESLSLTDIRDIAGLNGFVEQFPKAIKNYQSGNQQIIQSALHLAAIGELMPTILCADYNKNNSNNDDSNNKIIAITSTDISNYEQAFAYSLNIETVAPLTLENAQTAQMVLMRSSPANREHYAIVVKGKNTTDPSNDDTKSEDCNSKPEDANSKSVQTEEAPLVRIHSSCFTGDTLASLRCDCGDQLQSSIKFMSENEGGVIIYLIQDGRGIGLANKLRTYSLQEYNDMDTVQANEYLGFSDDQRPYLQAAAMLKKLDITSLKLLTNNPRKVQSLEEQGIEVVERVSIKIQPHQHTSNYLDVKFSKLGHI